MFFGFVYFIRTESFGDLDLHLLELNTALLHYLTSHLLVVVLEFADAFQLLNVRVNLMLVCLFKDFPSQALCDVVLLTSFQRLDQVFSLSKFEVSLLLFFEEFPFSSQAFSFALQTSPPALIKI